MWLHIINNNSKFLNRVVNLYTEVTKEDGINNKNVFYACATGEPIPENISVIEKGWEFKEILEEDVEWKGIIFNPLAPRCWKWLKYVPDHIPIVWYRWGAEAYNRFPALKSKYLLMPETKGLYRFADPISNLKDIYRVCREMLQKQFSAFQRVDVFVGPEREEFDLFRDVGLLSKNTVWKFGVVGVLEDNLSGIDDSLFGDGNLQMKDIKVGHSAAPSNNHIEAFRWLTKFDLSDSKVITPLSYASARYRDIVVKKGQEILGDRFEPILDFYPIDQYNKLMNRVGIAVMNNLRQQGGGNITADMWRGCKVFMNDTTAYRARKSWGLSLELISDQNEESFFAPKDPEIVEKDRTILVSKQGRANVLKKTRELLDYCEALYEKRK